MENKLIFLEFPVVTIATNTFIGVPIILRYEEENLMELLSRKLWVLQQKYLFIILTEHI